MKKIITFIFMMVLIISCSTGCMRRDTMENINIVTTVYPIEYVANRLYSKNNNITSIYPKGADSFTYKMSKKQLNDYSKSDLFIYNGLSDEREYAKKMLKLNNDLKIIDASFGLTDNYSSSDAWLNPSNILMIGQNIRNELKESIINEKIIEELDNNYELLNVDITELETEFRSTAENCNFTTIVSADESLNFLEKYGFDVINLTNKGKEKKKNIEKAKQLFEEKKLEYIFVLEHGKEYEIVKNIKDNYSLQTLEFKSLDTISDDDVKNNEDYISLMHYNIDLLKKETYK